MFVQVGGEKKEGDAIFQQKKSTKTPLTAEQLQTQKDIDALLGAKVTDEEDPERCAQSSPARHTSDLASEERRGNHRAAVRLAVSIQELLPVRHHARL